MFVPSSSVWRYGPNVPASLSPTMYTLAGFVGGRRPGRLGLDGNGVGRVAVADCVDVGQRSVVDGDGRARRLRTVRFRRHRRHPSLPPAIDADHPDQPEADHEHQHERHELVARRSAARLRAASRRWRARHSDPSTIRAPTPTERHVHSVDSDTMSSHARHQGGAQRYLYQRVTFQHVNTGAADRRRPDMYQPQVILKGRT